MADNGARKSARVNTVSGRSNPTKPSMAPASRGSARGGDDTRRSKVARPSKGGIPKEFIMAGVVICLLGIGTIAAWTIQGGKRSAIDKKNADFNEVHSRNIKTTFDSFQNAFGAGYKWIQGKDTTAKDDDLFGPLKSGPIYNVIFTRNFKDKKGKDQTEEKVMYPGRTKVKKFKQTETKDSVEMTRGETDDETKQAIYVANKVIQAEPGDNVNQGGSILVIVKTDKEVN